MPEDDTAVEFAPPDTTPYKAGNTGIDYLTAFDSAAPGPRVMLSALVHGNEIRGATALDFLFRQGVRPKRGKLTLGFMNIGAYGAFETGAPTASHFVEEDFNRLWSPEMPDGPRDGAELRHARDGGKPPATPYAECVLVMASRRLRKGEAAVRFGRCEGRPGVAARGRGEFRARVGAPVLRFEGFGQGRYPEGR